MEKTNKITETKKTVKKVNDRKKISKSDEEFKKSYFEYYDDIKISHREDW